jgi:hypothetical protein
MAILRLESGPQNSCRGGGEMAVSECLLAAINLRPETILYLRLHAGVPALRPAG